MEWVQIAAAGIAIVAAAVAVVQVRVTRTVANATLLRDEMRQYHSDQMRQMRFMVIEVIDKPLASWSDDEHTAVELVANEYTQIGYLMKNGYLPGNDLLDYWDVGIVRMYNACTPLIDFRRRIENNPKIHVYFEWLAREAHLNLQRTHWSGTPQWQQNVARTHGLTDGRYRLSNQMISRRRRTAEAADPEL